MSFWNKNQFDFQQKHYSAKIAAFVCDGPAPQFMKSIKSHNAYYGWERCLVHGKWEGRVVFDEINCNLRTNQSFINQEYHDHQIGKSPLIDSGIDCIMRFLLDYMHLVCGMKRLLLFRIEGPRPFRLAPIQISQIAERLKQHDRINSLWVCSTTQRLDELKRWKAAELRAFLLYPGPIVLKGILRPEKYIHFFVTIGLHKNPTRWTL